jgi:multisubunit Na+/H+ antiporter MnhF subunit
VALWSPQLFPRSRQRSLLLHLGQAAIASVVSLGAFGMIAWSLVGTLGFIPDFHALADASLAIGLLPFSLLVGALLGAIGGAAIGSACALVGRMSR